ncbi:hypothetical protein F383_17098 [Gossypium arboreum]|uniref:Uncharacterized protein n=1 Tax=Gossypium arboreum TaxID=29729 RepID=A0A0B0NIN9_GOSAR|nr:hypothetical protein F383_17098 [Gossypium arboreum]
MMLYTVEVVYPTYQFSIPYQFELRLLLSSKYMSYTYIVHHPFRIQVCCIMNVISE